MKITQEQIFSKIQGIMVELFELSPESIKMESKLNEDLGLDSIDAIDLLTHLQSFVGQRLHPEEFREIRTVAELIKAAEVTIAKAETQPSAEIPSSAEHPSSTDAPKQQVNVKPGG